MLRFDLERDGRPARRCLQNFVITGPKTTIPFYLNMANDPDFQNGDFDTSYLETHPHIFQYEEDNQRGQQTGEIDRRNPYRGENPYAK